MTKYIASTIFAALLGFTLNLNAQTSTGWPALDSLADATGATVDSRTNGSVTTWTVTMDGSDSLVNKQFFAFGAKFKAKSGYGKAVSGDYSKVAFVVTCTSAISPTNGKQGDQSLTFTGPGTGGSFLLGDIAADWTTWFDGGAATDNNAAVFEGKLGDDKSATAPLATTKQAARMPWEK